MCGVCVKLGSYSSGLTMRYSGVVYVLFCIGNGLGHPTPSLMVVIILVECKF